MNKKKILIVDDDPRNIFAMKATLKARNFECISCNDAIEALELLQGSEIVDVVLMDMMMPGMDGYEAIPRIRQLETRKGIPIISVTAQAMVGDRDKCINAGADNYISKPVDVDKLLKILAEY
jgi:CheY-like chemotaxis protein